MSLLALAQKDRERLWPFTQHCALMPTVLPYPTEGKLDHITGPFRALRDAQGKW